MNCVLSYHPEKKYADLVGFLAANFFQKQVTYRRKNLLFLYGPSCRHYLHLRCFFRQDNYINALVQTNKIGCVWIFISLEKCRACSELFL